MTENGNTDIVKAEKKTPIALGERGVMLRTLEDVWRFANYVIQAGMTPRGMDTPQKVLVAIELGAELGLPPMQAIQGIAVINNKPTLMGDLALALVLKSPQCQDVEEHIEGEGEEMVAVCRALRTGQDEWKETRFGVEDAKIAKLWGKDGTWQTCPKRMLTYRARGFRLRDSFADVLRGMHLTEEFIGVPAEPPPVSEASADVPTREERAELPAPEPGPTPQAELAEAIEGALAGKMPLLGDADKAELIPGLLATLARTTMGKGDAEYWADKANWTDEVSEKVLAVVQQTGIPDDLLAESKEAASEPT